MKIIRKLFGIVLSRKKIIIPALLMLVVLFFVLRPKPIVAVETTKVSRGNLETTLSVTGTVDSKKIVKLSFQSGGLLTYLAVQKGDNVSQYQTIASLDTRTVQKNLQNALIDYSKQRNTFEQTLQNNNAKNPNDATTDAIKRILQNNQFDLDKSVNSVELLDLAKQNSYLVSPIAGVVIDQDVKTAGVNVTAANSFTIADPNNLVVNMDVDEADVGKVTIGMPVRITLDAYPNNPLSLQVSSIDFASHTNSTGSKVFTVQADLVQNSDLSYRIGLTGDSEIVLSEKLDVIKIPTSALTEDNYVYVKRGKLFEKRKVDVGNQSDTETEVTSGLSEGEEIATSPTPNIPTIKK